MSTSSASKEASSASSSLIFGIACGFALTLTAIHQPLDHFLSTSHIDTGISHISLEQAIINSSYYHYQPIRNYNHSSIDTLTSSTSSSSTSSFPLDTLSSLTVLLLPYVTLTNVAAVAAGILLLWVYHLISRPLIFSRPLTPDQQEAALRKSYVDMPPPYPNSWFKLCDDLDVQPGQSFVVEAFEQRFRLSRDLHNTANLTCVDDQGKYWEVTEINRIIFVWYDAAGRSSAWQVPHVDMAQAAASTSTTTTTAASSSSSPLPSPSSISSQWKFVGRTSHEIICHIQEIPENGADTAHLDYLHGGFIIDMVGAAGARHTWDASWIPQPHPNTHIAKITIDTAVAVFGYKIKPSRIITRITQVGPGIVQLVFPTIFGSIILQETITPIHANLQRAGHVMWREASVPHFMAKAVMKATLIQFERDFVVWNHKRWLRAPMAVKEDGPILKYRRWMKQFFDKEGGALIRDMDKHEKMIDREELDRMRQMKEDEVGMDS